MGNGNFNAATRSFTQTMSPMTMASQSTTTSADLPQTGYLAAIDLIFTGTITTTGGGSTTNIGYDQNGPFPFGLIKKINLRTNEGADIWSTSAWGAYQYDRTIRSGFDPITNHSDFLNSGDTDPFAAYCSRPASQGASVVNTFAVPIRLQLTWGEMLMAGLVLLQNPGVRFTLSIDWGSTSNLWSASTAATLSNVTVTPYLELFLVPREDKDQPDLSLAKTVLEDIRPITQAGIFSYEPPRGNTYTRVIQEFVDKPSTYLPISQTYITNFNVLYSQTQNLRNDPVANRLFTQRRLYGADLPAGVYVTELSLGNGVPEFPNGRDNLDTSQITDFTLNTTISSSLTPGSGAFCRSVKEQLVVVQA
jgi:hypothetical protein